MSDRIHIRVTMDGTEAQRELMADGFKVCDMTALDVCEMIDRINGQLKAGRSGDYSINVSGRGFGLSFVDAIELQMQATSSLRW